MELDKESLEKAKLMLDISKIQADIEATRQSVTESQARARKSDVDIENIRQTMAQSVAESQLRVHQIEQDIAESRAMVTKMQKEMAWFPYLQIITTILTGGAVVF